MDINVLGIIEGVVLYVENKGARDETHTSYNPR